MEDLSKKTLIGIACLTGGVALLGSLIAGWMKFSIRPSLGKAVEAGIFAGVTYGAAKQALSK